MKYLTPAPHVWYIRMYNISCPGVTTNTFSKFLQICCVVFALQIYIVGQTDHGWDKNWLIGDLSKLSEL